MLPESISMQQHWQLHQHCDYYYYEQLTHIQTQPNAWLPTFLQQWLTEGLFFNEIAKLNKFKFIYKIFKNIYQNFDLNFFL